ncbi:MAG TPA: acetyl-CoA carboxylase biotin carboxyl carrier protein [Candidatus Acidoferrum sp.]|nr:acetyl-CoA carboxylase biotin carboxyl carrier protein [Candidatus Acidoferrum sp.]
MAKPKSQKASAAKTASGGVNLPEIERLLEFMDKHGLEEFEYEHGGLRIRLKKPSIGAGGYRALPVPEIVVAAPAIATTPSHAAGGTGSAPAPSHEVSGESGRSDDVHLVKSPIVGTYYGAPSPGAEAFVTVGSKVEAGQVLCIIEAMKLMNEIEADVAGEVVRIFAENGNPVEYGEPLFGIRPLRKK